MSESVIRVENLSKRYRIGGSQGKFTYGSLRDSLANTATAPFRRLRRLASGSPPGDPAYIWALKDVSFEVRHGEALGIIGRNGAGKSTLLKILSRITKPTEGRAIIRGRVGSLLEVGTGFHPELTGRENIYLNGSILGMRRREIERRFDEIVAFSEVEKFLDTPVKYYSSGMYVRLAFAVAAHLEPEILLVDEVLAVGDVAFQKKCLGKMEEVASGGRTVLFVSHNMAAVEALCSNGCLLNNGKIADFGKTDEVIKHYLGSVRDITSEDLLSRSDRSGNGSLVFSGVSLENADGITVDYLVSGKDAFIVLDYQGKDNLRNVSVSIGFYGLYGQFLLLCNNEMAGQPFQYLPQKGKIRCSIPRLPFAPGSYILNLFCEVNGVLSDWVQEACLLSVSEGDYYGTGKNVPTSHGGFLINHNWTWRPIEIS